MKGGEHPASDPLLRFVQPGNDDTGRGYRTHLDDDQAAAAQRVARGAALGLSRWAILRLDTGLPRRVRIPASVARDLLDIYRPRA